MHGFRFSSFKEPKPYRTGDARADWWLMTAEAFRLSGNVVLIGAGLGELLALSMLSWVWAIILLVFLAIGGALVWVGDWFERIALKPRQRSRPEPPIRHYRRPPSR
jgi:hypothetical protein